MADKKKVMFQATRIIVMEDVAFMREIFWQIFSATEMNVLCFPSSGEELMLKAKELKPDIILMDLVLPNENGIALIKKVRPMYPDINIIAVSSLDDEHIVIEAFKAGVSDFIKKPFTSDEIINSIREVSEQKQLDFQKLAA